MSCKLLKGPCFPDPLQVYTIRELTQIADACGISAGSQTPVQLCESITTKLKRIATHDPTVDDALHSAQIERLDEELVRVANELNFIRNIRAEISSAPDNLVKAKILKKLGSRDPTTLGKQMMQLMQEQSRLTSVRTRLLAKQEEKKQQRGGARCTSDSVDIVQGTNLEFGVTPNIVTIALSADDPDLRQCYIRDQLIQGMMSATKLYEWSTPAQNTWTPGYPLLQSLWLLPQGNIMISDQGFLELKNNPETHFALKPLGEKIVGADDHTMSAIWNQRRQVFDVVPIGNASDPETIQNIFDSFVSAQEMSEVPHENKLESYTHAMLDKIPEETLDISLLNVFRFVPPSPTDVPEAIQRQNIRLKAIRDYLEHSLGGDHLPPQTARDFGNSLVTVNALLAVNETNPNNTIFTVLLQREKNLITQMVQRRRWALYNAGLIAAHAVINNDISVSIDDFAKWVTNFQSSDYWRFPDFEVIGLVEEEQEEEEEPEVKQQPIEDPNLQRLINAVRTDLPEDIGNRSLLETFNFTSSIPEQDLFFAKAQQHKRLVALQQYISTIQEEWARNLIERINAILTDPYTGGVTIAKLQENIDKEKHILEEYATHRSLNLYDAGILAVMTMTPGFRRNLQSDQIVTWISETFDDSPYWEFPNDELIPE